MSAVLKQHLVLASFAFAALAHAQPAPAPKPAVQVGEVATYAVNLIADRQVTEDVLTVTDVADGRIKVRFARANRTPVETEAVYTDEWNSILVGSSGSRLDPSSQALKFPLEPGKTWESKYMAQGATGFQSRVELASKVLGFEKVKTPAGEFDAYKVENSGWVNGVSWTGAFKVVQTAWYAPTVGRVVRSEYKEYRRGGVESVSELKSFTAAK